MNDWFEFNGVKCTEYGIHVSDQPPVTLPSERVTFTDIPGRCGSLTELEDDNVYSDMTLTATCFVSDVSRLDEITAWLKGSGKVTFANRQGGFYYGRVVNQISFDKVMRGKPNCTVAINFRVKPFFYSNDENVQVITESGTAIVNPGTVEAAPLIKVEGSGEGTLMIGSTTMLFDDMTEAIYVDCDAKMAYTGEGTTASPRVLATQKVTGEWITIAPGNNFVSFTGGITKVTITPRWRWL